MSDCCSYLYKPKPESHRCGAGRLFGTCFRGMSPPCPIAVGTIYVPTRCSFHPTKPFTPSVPAYKEQVLLCSERLTDKLLSASFVRPFYRLFPPFSRKKSCENTFFEEKLMLFCTFLQKKWTLNRVHNFFVFLTFE